VGAHDFWRAGHGVPLDKAENVLMPFQTKWLLPLLGAIMLMIAQVKGYFNMELGAVLGWVILLFTIKTQASKTINIWLIISVLLLIISWVLPIRTLLFLYGMSAIYYASTAIGYRPGWLSMLIAIIMSPVFFIAGHVFTFPLRLWLSDITAKILQGFGQSITVQGNQLFDATGQQFSVDPACAGIALWQTTALLQLFLASTYLRKNRITNPLTAVPLLLIAIGGTTIANVIRLVMLVLFNVPANTISHDLVGLSCALVYGVLPLYGYFKYVKPGTQATTETESTTAQTNLLSIAISLVLLALLAFKLLTFKQTLPQSLIERYKHEIPGMTYRVISGDVTQYYSDSMIVYIKPIPSFYSSEHHPGLCWQGSGYELTAVNETSINGITLYTGTLKGATILQTAWWYDNGKSTTSSQWAWRREMFSGAPEYAIVNVSVPQNANLTKAVAEVMKMKLVR
jgi:exosortase N